MLIVPRDSNVPLDSFESLGKGTIKRLAIGEPKTVPAGEYAVQVLKKLKLDDALADKLVYGSNVRQVLDYVTRGEVTAGVVYATDAKQAGDKVKVVATAPEDSHEPIVYPAVLVKKSRNAAAARRFLDHLATDDARHILQQRGFTTPPAARRNQARGPPAMSEGLWQPLGLSLRVAGIATLLTVLLGTPLAYAMARRAFPGRSLVEGFILLPLVLPPTVVGYFIIMALGSRGWLTRWLGDSVDYSIVFRFEGAVLAALDRRAADALHARQGRLRLGRPRPRRRRERSWAPSRLQVFWHVSIPLARRGLFSGLLLAFARRSASSARR